MSNETHMRHAYHLNEAAEQAGISKALLYKLCKQGKGPVLTKIGFRTVIRHEALAEWLKTLEEASND